MLKWIKLQLEKYRPDLRKKSHIFSQTNHNHYFFQLPDNIGILSTFILRLFFSGIKVAKEQTQNLNKLQEQGIVIYVTKPKSYFLYLFYYTRFKQEGLPYPRIGFDYKIMIWQPVSRFLKIFCSYLSYIFHNLSLPDPYASGYIRKELMNRRPALLSLVEQKGFHRRFIKAKKDPVQYLIEMQQSIDRPIFLVPQLMFFDKKPDRSLPTIIDILFGTKENPGKIRRLMILFKNPGKVFVEISEPVNLKTFLALPENRKKNIEYQTLALRRKLLNQINRHRQSITGPVLKSRLELKENILTRERLQNFMEHHSKTRDIPIQKVQKKASDFLDEIAANYNMMIIKTASALITWVLNTMFEGVTVDKDGLNRVKSMSYRLPDIVVSFVS